MADDPVVYWAGQQIPLILTDTCIAGDAIGLNSSGNWVRADADVAAPIRAEFFALQRGNVSGDEIKVAKQVVLYDKDAPYVKGALQFLSGTAGKHTETNPIAAGDLVQCLGKALSTEYVHLDAELPHLTVPFSLVSTLPATAANYGNIFVADRNWRIIGAREAHTVAGSDAGAVTLTLEKLTDTQALDAGVTMLAGTFNLKATADTEQAVGPTATVANARLKPGDRVALKDAGVLTVVAGVSGSATFVEDL